MSLPGNSHSMCQLNGRMRASSSPIWSKPIGMPPLLSVLSRTPRAPRSSSAASSLSVMSMVMATTQRARFGVSALSAVMPSRIAELSVP